MYKSIFSLVLLFFSINELNCMEQEVDAQIENVENNSEKLESMIDSSELEKIKSEINESQNIFATAEGLLLELDSLILNKSFENINIDKLTKLFVEQCAGWLIEKIVKDKLLEYQETDQIRLLFDRGIKLPEKIESSESFNSTNESEAVSLLNLPNEILLPILLEGLDKSFDSVGPKVDHEDKANDFFRNRLSWFQLEENKGQNIAKALNAQLLSATCAGIKFIANVLRVNRCFYFFAGELLNHLKDKISHEIFHELVTNQNSFGLLSLMLKAQKIDVNYNFKKRWGRNANLFQFFITSAISKSEKSLDTSNVKQIIKMLMDRDAHIGLMPDLSDTNVTVLYSVICQKDEDFAIFLLKEAPAKTRAIMLCDKRSMQLALINDMQKLVNVMIENGAVIEAEDLEEVEKRGEALALKQADLNKVQASKSQGCIVC